MTRERHDLVVVGAGPAGLAAAAEAASLGLATLLLDEQPAPGGQIYRAVDRASPAQHAWLGRDYGAGRALTGALRASGAEHLARATVFDAAEDGWIGFEQEGVARFVHGERILLATGALERPFPIPGWTLPGVMTAGAAQILLKTAAILPGQDTVLAGSGPLLYLLAAQLVRAGAPPRAVLDTTPAGAYRRALPALLRALGAAPVLAKGLGLLAELRRSPVAHVTGVERLRAEGDDQLRAVVYERKGKEARLDADLLLLHQGVVPNIQLGRMLGCAHGWDARQLCWSPVLDRWGRTSLERVFVAGDGGGIQGAVAAEPAGRIAALAIAADLGRLDPGERDRRAAPWRRRLGRERPARPFLDVLYRPPEALRVPPDDATLVCRCEEVTAGAIRAAVRRGAEGPNQLKAFTRCGMGPCQGRMCGLTVCELIAAERGVSPDAVGYYRLRPPTKPVRLGALAAMAAPVTAADAPPGQAEFAGRRA